MLLENMIEPSTKCEGITFIPYANLCVVKHDWKTFAFEGERSLRPSKIRQSVSKCFRKLDGLKRFASIQTVLDTANKNKIDHNTIIRAVLDGTADSLLASVLG